MVLKISYMGPYHPHIEKDRKRNKFKTTVLPFLNLIVFLHVTCLVGSWLVILHATCLVGSWLVILHATRLVGSWLVFLHATCLVGSGLAEDNLECKRSLTFNLYNHYFLIFNGFLFLCMIRAAK